MNRITFPKLTGLVSFFAAGAAMAAGPAPSGLPPSLAWVEPLLPYILPPLMAGGAVMTAWVLRTCFGVTMGATASALDKAAEVLEKQKDGKNDSAESIKATMFREFAKRLREAEKTIPFGKKSE